MRDKLFGTRAICLALTFVLCMAALPLPCAQAADLTQEDIDTKSAMIVERSADNTEIINLLNKQTLHPQKTGYTALDKLLASVLEPYANQTTAEKVKACYAWTIRNIDYSWAGYTKSNSGYDGFKETYPYNDYEDGLQKAFPEDVIARTYYTMDKHKGVCYDWGAVFAVMVRYIGIDAYVHTGDFKFEESLGFSSTAHGHHGWTEIVLDGKYYIFDPQREYRMTDNGRGTINYSRYFGVTSGSANYFRYTEETSINAKRDAGFLSVSAHRQKLVPVNGIASRSGSVTGSGRYDIGTTATLKAVPNTGKNFEGWYDAQGNLLSSELSYAFRVEGKTTVYAMFEGDLFYDIPANAWYEEYAMRAAEMGLIAGTAPHRFGGNVQMSRAMAVQIIANMEDADLSAYTDTRFADVPTGQWYTAAIGWASENGIVSGVSETKFEPDRSVTRQELLTMAVNYLTKQDVEMKSVDWDDLPYVDKDTISDWAVEPVCRAAYANLMSGYEDGTLRPKNKIIRSEGVTVFIHVIDFMEAAAQGGDDSETPAA